MKKLCWTTLIITVMFLLSTITIAGAAPCNETVEGEGNHFVTGGAYPADIYVTGYDVTNNKLYVNFTLETTTSVDVAETATFNYYVEIFDDSASNIGNDGTYESSSTVAGNAGDESKTVTNKEISVGTLTAEYRLLITVKSVSIS